MAFKIWQKEAVTDAGLAALVHEFTAGSDGHFDLLLAAADVKGSLAHAEMLCRIGLITEQEWQQLHQGLNEIADLISKGQFVIEEGVEDVHSQVEMLLTKKFGDTGKKLHSGRSRNDQVLLDIRLFLKGRIVEMADTVQALFHAFQQRSEELKDVYMPGYTHFQLAMPSSFGMWLGAQAESLADDMEMLLAAARVNDRNPLGTGAGFGSSFPLDREFTTGKLGFSDLLYNSMYAQLSRGKVERLLALAMASIASTLNRFAADACLFMNQQFAFIAFPDELTTGSSIMPHKKNPDVFEIIRARCNRILALPNELAMLTANLPSGYHRDLQLTKEILFPALDSLMQCLEMTELMVRHMKAREQILENEVFNDLFTVEEVNRRVLNGEAFRDAYVAVGLEVKSGSFSPDRSLQHTHAGSIGNLCNAQVARRFERIYSEIPR